MKITYFSTNHKSWEIETSEHHNCVDMINKITTWGIACNMPSEDEKPILQKEIEYYICFICDELHGDTCIKLCHLNSCASNKSQAQPALSIK